MIMEFLIEIDAPAIAPRTAGRGETKVQDPDSNISVVEIYLSVILKPPATKKTYNTISKDSICY